MKHCLFLAPFSKVKKQKGQSLLEFLLLFVLIVLWAFFLLKESNSTIAGYWKALVIIIVNDPSQNIELF